MSQAIRLLISTEKIIPTIGEEHLYQDNDGFALANRAALGNSEAFGKFYEMYLERIFRYVYYQVRDKMTAEDLTEEVFMKAWKALGSFSGKRQSLSTWLYRIARNHIIDYFRSQHKYWQLPERLLDATETSAAAVDPEQVAQNNLMQEEVLNLVSLLPEQQKEIVILKFIEKLDNHEIEQITGRSQGSIRIAQMRALATLKQKLNGRQRQCIH